MSDERMSREEFYEKALGDTMPDKFSATLRRNPDQRLDALFSVEGFETIGYQLHDFVMARTAAYFKRNGRPPAAVRAELRLVFDDTRSDDELFRDEWQPWYAADDTGLSPMPLDGTHRFTAFLRERRDYIDNKGGTT